MKKSQSTSLNINLVKLCVTTFIIFSIEIEKREDQFWSREEEKIQSDEVGQCEGKNI